MKLVRIVLLATAFALVVSTGFGQDAPNFYQDTYPEHALKSRLEAEDVLKGKGAELDAKTRELIALGFHPRFRASTAFMPTTKMRERQVLPTLKFVKPSRLLPMFGIGVPF